jgi:hypothetical protein
MLDLQDNLFDLCDYSSLYCSEAQHLEREIRKLER